MKNRLGKVTFVFICIFLAKCVFDIILSWRLVYMMGDWDMIKAVIFSDGVISFLKALDNIFGVGNIICLAIALVYTMKIIQSKRINRFVYVFTALAILVDIFFDTIYWNEISGFGDVFVCVLLFLLKCTCFISFILLFARYNNEKMKKTVRITLGCTYICTAIYFIINGLIFLFFSVLSQYQYIGDMISVSDVILWILGGVIWPIFVLIVGGLVLGYILFPEKYIKIEN